MSRDDGESPRDHGHPSGRPIRRPEYRKLSIMRNPGMGPIIDRLRHPEAKDLIGFHRTWCSTDNGDEEV